MAICYSADKGTARYPACPHGAQYANLIPMKITFGPHSAIYKALQDGSLGDGYELLRAGKIVKNRVIYEFEKGPHAKQLNPVVRDHFLKSRSEPMATIGLNLVLGILQRGEPIPSPLSEHLIEALERVSKKRGVVEFWYGPRTKAGRPKRDMAFEFGVFKIIEQHTGGSLKPSRTFDKGVYGVVREKYATRLSTHLSVHEFQTIHESVRKNASEDIDYLNSLLLYLESFGFRPKNR